MRNDRPALPWPIYFPKQHQHILENMITTLHDHNDLDQRGCHGKAPLADHHHDHNYLEDYQQRGRQGKAQQTVDGDQSSERLARASTLRCESESVKV